LYDECDHKIGGPGGSSTGFGNFMEIGPQDVDLKPRNTSWVKYANLLFIDNPVGTGFSYVSNPNAYAKNNSQIAIDLVALLKEFFKKLPEFQVRAYYHTFEINNKTLLYQFCYSYN
jgi:serine carboxypeptidase 1